MASNGARNATGTTKPATRPRCDLCGRNWARWAVTLTTARMYKAPPVYLCSSCKEKADQWGVVSSTNLLP